MPGTGVRHTESAPRADEPCVTGCAAPARGTRHDPSGERPSALDQHATDPRRPVPAPVGTGPGAAPSAAPPLSSGPAAQHRGRAPPARPGS
ncbi:hypothetical protein AB0D49_23060 [Streptomyces sp. NPDC048290]|uniref:hypothetical protein n=1 Tax=Streptomyces sp. NPDC048290 TaxID=3155811 RepID=UPI0034480B58